MAGNGSGGAAPIYDAHLFGAEGKYKRNSEVNKQNTVYLMWLRQIISLAANRFKWTGLPDSVDIRFMEMCLTHYGLAIYYHDDSLNKDLVVQGAGTTYVNMLQNPTAFTVIGPGPAPDVDQQTIYNKTLSAYNRATDYAKIDKDPKRAGFPIWANYARTPDLDAFQIYAARIAQIERTVEINTLNMRHPKVLRGNQDVQLTLMNIARAYDKGDSVLVLNDEGINPDAYEVLDFTIPSEQISTLMIARTRWFNDLMTIMGIDNSNQDKKERLVASEVDANNDQTASFRAVNLNARQEAANDINRVFGLDIKVEYNSEVEKMAQQLAKQAGVDSDQDQEEDNG